VSKDIDDLLNDLEVKAKEVSLSNDIEKLHKQIISLRKILETYGINEEMHITNIEYICQKGIDDLKHLAMEGGLDSDATKTLDLLHKNLRTARGKLNKKDVPGKATAESELLRIVNGKDEQS
jgi:hypothetical protein